MHTSLLLAWCAVLLSQIDSEYVPIFDALRTFLDFYSSVDGRFLLGLDPAKSSARQTKFSLVRQTNKLILLKNREISPKTFITKANKAN